MWPYTPLTEKVSIQLPIIQAPMAGGATTPELVAAVSNSGGLGALGAGYMTAQAIQDSIVKIRALTNRPFSVNLFIPEKHHANLNQINQMCTWVEQSCTELHINVNQPTAPFAADFEEQMTVILEAKIPVFSFAFGILNNSWVSKLKAQGIYLIGTATNLKEAQLLEASQVDAVVAQGRESGGHRGTFIGEAEDALFKSDKLIKECVTHLKIPVIAAGGIMNGQDIASALRLGAAAVQMGTAFLTCHESGIHLAYKNALLNAQADNTTLTRVFSGKMARGIRNKFIERMTNYEDNVLDYPIQNALTQPMRKQATIQNNSDFMSLWAGQSVSQCKACSASQLLTDLVNEVNSVFKLPD